MSFGAYERASEGDKRGRETEEEEEEENLLEIGRIRRMRLSRAAFCQNRTGLLIFLFKALLQEGK